MADPRKKPLIYSDIPYLTFLFILSVFICWPLFNERLITTIDGGDHLLRLYSMVQFIGHGQWFVRWIPYLHGYGYPEFNFYPPLVALVGTFLAKAGLSILWSLNITAFLFILLSGFTMYFFAKEFWGTHGGFLSAVAYIFAPYLMLDLYARGDYSEAASFAFLPLILWAFFRLRKDLKTKYLPIAALSVAGLFLANNCVTLMFFPVILLYMFILYFPLQRQDLRSFFFSLSALGLGIGLASFYWIPALMEKEFVYIGRMLSGNLDFHHNFLSIKELIYSSWPRKPGTRLPYEIGPLHCLLAVTSICFLKKITNDRRSLFLQLLFLGFVLIASLYLALPWSLIIWEHISILRYLQFSSRFLVIITFAVSFFSGGVVLLWRPHHTRTIMAVGVLAIFLVSFSRCQPPYGSEKVGLTKVAPSVLFRYLQAQDGGEFIPIWAKVIRNPVPLQSLEIIKGEGKILDQSNMPEVHQRFTVEISSPSLLCFNVFYFPGWSIKVDGHSVDILKDNPFGLIIFPLNEGIHEIKADFGPTPLRLAATIISFISLLIMAVLLLIRII